MADRAGGTTRRERDFHDQRFSGAAHHRDKLRKYYEVDAGRHRYLELLARVVSGQRVLELGCGPASQAPALATQGAAVVAADISPVALTRLRRRAVEASIDLQACQMDAHALAIGTSTMDLVCGSSVLHHLDIPVALGELQRILRPDGQAVFLEPLGHNPLINLYRRSTPGLRTADEHPLVEADLHHARGHFREVEAEPFNLTALAGLPARRIPGGRRGIDQLHRLDRLLFRHSRLARRWAWIVVIRLARPIAPDSPHPG